MQSSSSNPTNFFESSIWQNIWNRAQTQTQTQGQGQGQTETHSQGDQVYVTAQPIQYIPIDLTTADFLPSVFHNNNNINNNNDSAHVMYNRDIYNHIEMHHQFPPRDALVHPLEETVFQTLFGIHHDITKWLHDQCVGFNTTFPESVDKKILDLYGNPHSDLAKEMAMTYTAFKSTVIAELKYLERHINQVKNKVLVYLQLAQSTKFKEINPSNLTEFMNCPKVKKILAAIPSEYPELSSHAEEFCCICGEAKPDCKIMYRCSSTCQTRDRCEGINFCIECMLKHYWESAKSKHKSTAKCPKCNSGEFCLDDLTRVTPKILEEHFHNPTSPTLETDRNGHGRNGNGQRHGNGHPLNNIV